MLKASYSDFARVWCNSERVVNRAWGVIEDDVEKFKLKKEDVIRSFSVVLERRSYFPDLPKDVIVGCGRIRESPRRPTLADELPQGCHPSCAKEEILYPTKIPIVCSPCEDDCSICMEPLSSDVMATSCDHKFHRECLYNVKTFPDAFWFKCPLCRHKVSGETIENLQSDFDYYKKCRCCPRHQERRPKDLSPDACSLMRACGSGMSVVLRTLLDYSDLRNNEGCECRGVKGDGVSCRSNLRAYCRLLQ